jgi:ribosomal protein S18 acetylase RimI-like enzyme
MEVRLAQPVDWATVRDVRLRALGDAPAAFASTLEREIAFDAGEWRSRVTRGPWWLAFDGDRPVGLVAAFPEDGDTHLVAMWVEPGARGTSAATELVETVCSHGANDGARAVRLWVADGNDRARRFYERVGFLLTGERQPLPSNPAMGEELMRRPLRA